MAVSIVEYDATTKCAGFAISSPSDLTKLPTTKNNGTDELANCSPVCMGSNAICLSNSAVYMLDGATDTWKMI